MNCWGVLLEHNLRSNGAALGPGTLRASQAPTHLDAAGPRPQLEEEASRLLDALLDVHVDFIFSGFLGKRVSVCLVRCNGHFPDFSRLFCLFSNLFFSLVLLFPLASFRKYISVWDSDRSHKEYIEDLIPPDSLRSKMTHVFSFRV